MNDRRSATAHRGPRSRPASIAAVAVSSRRFPKRSPAITIAAAADAHCRSSGIRSVIRRAHAMRNAAANGAARLDPGSPHGDCASAARTSVIERAARTRGQAVPSAPRSNGAVWGAPASSARCISTFAISMPAGEHPNDIAPSRRQPSREDSEMPQGRGPNASLGVDQVHAGIDVAAVRRSCHQRHSGSHLTSSRDRAGSRAGETAIRQQACSDAARHPARLQRGGLSIHSECTYASDEPFGHRREPTSRASRDLVGVTLRGIEQVVTLPSRSLDRLRRGCGPLAAGAFSGGSEHTLALLGSRGAAPVGLAGGRSYQGSRLVVRRSQRLEDRRELGGQLGVTVRGDARGRGRTRCPSRTKPAHEVSQSRHAS